VRLLHVSDSHLGHSSFGVGGLIDDPLRPGIPTRQGEFDIRSGFSAALDTALKAEVDLVVHSGDLFDTARPPAYVIDFAMAEIKRLGAAGVPMVIVEGNSSFPRDRSLGHPLQILRHLPLVTVVCEDPAVVDVGSWQLHAYPHRAVYQGEWPTVRPDKAGVDGSILIAHGVADGLRFFRGARPAPALQTTRVAAWFSYIALGHYHRHAQVPGTDNAFYAGSTAMVGWGDHRPGDEFSVILFDSDAETRAMPIGLPTRPMRSYGLDDAGGLSREEVIAFLQEQVAAVPPDGANCRMVVNGLDPMVRRELRIGEVAELLSAASATQVELGVRQQMWEAVRAGIAGLGGSAERFKKLLAASDGDEAFKAEVEQVGNSILEEAEVLAAREDAGEPAEDPA
jgi:DNA repair exonuclease SbcCD nuclease subunit